MSISRTEEYYKKFIDLQDKLRKSEDERLKLEIKFNEMVQVTREEEQAHYRKLRSQYKKFLEEDYRRQDRNDRILKTLERIECRVTMLRAKTERFKILRQQYNNILHKIYSSNQDKESQTVTHQFVQLDDVRDPVVVNSGDIFEKYLKESSSQKLKDSMSSIREVTRKSGLPYTFSPSETHESVSRHFMGAGEPRNYANSVADDIINSIYSKPAQKLPGSDKNRVKFYQSGDDSDSSEKPACADWRSERKNDTLIDRNYSVGSNKPYLLEGVQKDSVGTNAETGMGAIKENKNSEVQETAMPLANSRPGFDSPQNKIGDDKEMGEFPFKYNSTIVGDRHELEKVSLEQMLTPKIQQKYVNDHTDQQINQPKDFKDVDAIEKQTNQHQKKDYQSAQQYYDEKGAEYVTEPGIIQQPTQKLGDQEVIEQIGQNDQQVNQVDKLPMKQYNNDQFNQQYLSNTEPLQQYDENGQPGQQYDGSAHPKPEYNENDQTLQQYGENVVQPHSEDAAFQQYETNSQPLELPQQCDENGQPFQQYEDTNVQLPQQYDETNSQPVQQNVEHGQLLQKYEETGVHFPQQYNQTNNQPVQQYDEHGQPLPEYDENGQLPQQYDENGQPLQQYDENGQLLQQYDENGQPFQQYEETNVQLLQQYDETTGQPVQQYDEHGQLLQQYDESGQPLQQYDENGQSLQQYEETGQPLQQYDETGQPLQQYDENGQPFHQQYYDQPVEQYDENGQPITQYSDQIHYDETGQPVGHFSDQPYQQQQYDKHGQPLWQYDENGQPMTEFDASTEQYRESGHPVTQYDETEQQEQSQEVSDAHSQPQNEESQPQSSELEKDDGSKLEKLLGGDEVKKSNVFELLDTDTESAKQDTKVSNDSDFDFSNDG